MHNIRAQSLYFNMIRTKFCFEFCCRQTDAFAKWNLTERYEDEGIILYSHQIVPLLRMYYKSYLGGNHSVVVSIMLVLICIH